MYYHPMGLCEIWSVGKDRIWKLHAPAAFAAPEANVTVYPYLTGITVTLDQERISAFQVSFDAPYEEGIKMLSEDEGGVSPFNQQNLVRACIGYPAQNLWTPWYYGMLNQGGEGVEVSSDGVKGTISVQQANWQDDHVAQGASSWKSVVGDLIQSIADLMRAKVVISEGAQAAMDAADARRKGEPWCTFGWSNMKALRKISLICGLIMTIHSTNSSGDPTVIEFTTRHEESQVGRQEEQIVNKYIMRGGFNPLENEYPILSWSPEAGIASWLGSKPENTNEGVTAAAINPRTGNVVTTSVTPGEVDNPSYGDTVAKGEPQDRSSKDGKILDAATDGVTAVPSFLGIPARSGVDDATNESDLRAKALMMMTQGNMAQIATISTLGVPTQGLWKKIAVLGCSPRYDGPYFVQSVTHRWAPGVFDSELKIVRQGTFATDETVKTPIQTTQMTKG